MSVLDAIGGLIDSAKRLRALAEELQSVELKSRIVDEIVRLQELREQAFIEENSVNGDMSRTVIENFQIQNALAGDEMPRTARLEPSADGETYSLSPLQNSSAELDSDEETAAAALSANENGGKASPPGSDTELEISSTSDTMQIPAASVKPEDLSEDQRFAVAQARIAELEPLHQTALKKMNDVLTDEQKAAKRAATKKARKAGLKGKELQSTVMASLELTEKQHQKLSSAREKLHRIRLAISHQVKGLLSKEQLDQMLRGKRTP